MRFSPPERAMVGPVVVQIPKLAAGTMTKLARITSGLPAVPRPVAGCGARVRLVSNTAGTAVKPLALLGDGMTLTSPAIWTMGGPGVRALARLGPGATIRSSSD